MKKAISILVLVCFAASPAWASPVGRLSYLEGRVDRRMPDGSYAPLAKDEPVSPGDILRTKGDSRIEIAFDDASTVKLGENAQLHLKEYSIGADGKRQNARLHLDRGVMRAIVSKSATGEQNFTIDTPNAGGSVKGSDIGVSYLKSSSTFLAMSGAIEARHAQFPDKTVLIEKGSTAFVPAEAPAQEARPFLAAEADNFRDNTAPLLARDANVTSGDLSKAIVTDTLGDVRIKAKGSAQWHRAALKEILGEGDEIETGENGGLRLVLESGRIVELGPETQMTIDGFKIDQASGSREDLLSSKRGEIRARIDKLKGNSKFQVTTPTAIASVRGTIMYLQISPEATQAFFEAGHGALTNLLNGVERTVDPGQNARADNQGHVSEPVITTPEQHQRLEGKFSSQEQGFRMFAREDAPPPTVIEKVMTERGPGGNERGTIHQRADRDSSINQDQRNTDILQTVSIRLPRLSVQQTFTGDISNGKFFFFFAEAGTNVTGQNRNSQGFYESGSLSGSLFGLGNFAGGAASNAEVAVILSGAYNDGFIPATQASVLAFESSGSGFRGFTGALVDGNSGKGFSKFMFISPFINTSTGQREAGIATGDVTGFFVEGSTVGEGSWLLGDGFSSVFKGNTNLLPQDLPTSLETAPLAHVGTGTGNFGGNGSMTMTSFKGSGINIQGQNWGIWKALMGGANTAAEDDFTVSLSGRVDSSNPVFDSDAVFLGRFVGTWDSVNDITGDVDALWISEPDGDGFLEAGTLKGEAFGNSSGAYADWQASAVGEFNRTTATLQLSQVKNFINTNAAAYGIAEVAAYARAYALNAGSFNGTGSITGSMNTTFYGTNGNSSANGIWAALINGGFTGMPGTVSSWSANLKVGANPVEGTLTGVSWADGKWTGTVASNGSAPVSFSGTAAGTYTLSNATDGTFEGAGVGTWQNQ